MIIAREINSRTGNYHDFQDQDLYQSVEDRMFTPLGARTIYPTYGFPISWPQLGSVRLRDAITDAINGDEFVDRMAFRMVGPALIVDVETDARPDY